MDCYRIGVDIGGTKIAYGLFDPSGKLIEKRKLRTDNLASQDEFSDNVSREILSIMQDNRITKEQMEGAALCFPSSVDYEHGTVTFTPMIPSLQNYNAKKMLSERLPDMKVLVENDTNAAALAEYTYGAGQGHPHMLFTTIGTGMGSGLILDGRLYHGAFGGAGESGHMIIEPKSQDRFCGCGNAGCFMGMAAGGCLCKRVRDDILHGEKTLIASLTDSPDQITGETIKKAYDAGDPYAKRLVREEGYYIGLYVYNSFCLLNCDCFVLGGGMMHFGKELIDTIRDTFDEYSRHLVSPGNEIVIEAAKTGDDMGIIGASELLRYESIGSVS